MIVLGSLRTQDCQQIRRRELLQMGACSALGLSLPQWLAGAASGIKFVGEIGVTAVDVGRSESS